MKTYWDINLGTRWRSEVNFTPLLLYPRESKPVANEVEAEWAQNSEYFLRLTTNPK